MCMLTAMVPTQDLSDDDIKLGKLLFASLILRNAHTNRDGFGIASTGKVHFKTTEAANKVMFGDPCIIAVTEALTKPFIGHVRTTSTGRNAKDGSHPFFVGPLAVTHNGTFTNYKGVLKENADIAATINDPDPVDSNVFAHFLDKVKGKGLLTGGHIETALKEMEGSYAVMVAEVDQDFIWVVRGANGLYQATVGPYRVVNTSKANLEGAAQEVACTLKLLFGSTLEVSDAVAVPTFGVYKLLANGLVKQSDLPKPPVVTYNYTSSNTGWQGRHYSSPAPTSPTAISRAALAAEITTIPGITYTELKIAANTLCECSWYDTNEEDLLVIQQTLEVLSSRHYSKEKTFWWEHIKTVVGDSSPYESVENVKALMGSGGEVFFPYFIHSVEELEQMLALIRGGDNVIIS